MAVLQNKITWLCYGISLVVFIVVFTVSRGIVTSYPSGYVTLSFYITAATAFLSALTLGTWGNFLKWFYPIMALAFAYLFSIDVIGSNQVYLYLHHNHGVNEFIIPWAFFLRLTAIAFLGLIVGVGIKLIIRKRKGQGPGD